MSTWCGHQESSPRMMTRTHLERYPNPMKDDRIIYLVASGDLRLEANQICWPAQAAMEQALAQPIERLGGRVVRAHPYLPDMKHGFLDSQRYGMDVFKAIPEDA